MRHFNLRESFWRELPVMKLQDRMGNEGLVCLLRLLTWAAEHCDDGTFNDCAKRNVEIAAGWRGETGKFFGALVDAGCITGGVDAPNGEFVEPYLLPWADDYMEDA